ncbi:DNA polymerase lambda isoform X2 [Phycodurus eques]|uniref:DNA polymerase lambda isoform X2 n=1 Tax=Phycodurus eques TaxID=693459 RepID=UPI002ACDBB9E|nr:DNA polymerase lambda isoform X2 [Phycodurus eques]
MLSSMTIWSVTGLCVSSRDSETQLEKDLLTDKSAAEMLSPACDQSKQGETLHLSVSDKEDMQGEEDGVCQSHLEALITGQCRKEDAPGSSLDPGRDTTTHMVVSGKWVCAQSSQSKSNNFNKHITDKLEQLAKAYTHQGDKWRALSYSKAVNALKRYHKAVTSYQEACVIPGIGKRMADKIDEIMESGHLRKLDHIGEAVPILELFTNIWGAGTKTAQLWYQQGFRTLEDIRTKAHLSNTQKIGLKHYNDFLDRMPREEAAAIEKVVRHAAQEIDPGLVVMACGSYRRGKSTCGDVDVLISQPDGKSHKGVFSNVLQSLHDTGFLTDDLVSHEENGKQKKYMGVCRLPGPDRRHRRLDVIVVPYNEFSCALMYFTGSAHFNRSMRALAKTKNMSLSEHSLNQSVVRQGSAKVYAGTPLPTPTESAVFNHLGIPYRQPCERDW